jgi:hypothetical protein
VTVLNISSAISSTTARPHSVNKASHSSIVTDLGILTDSRLLFKDHINSITAMSSQRSGAIFRGFDSCNASPMRKAFITYMLREFLSKSRVYETHLINTYRKVQISLYYTKHIRIKLIQSILQLSVLRVNFDSLELGRLRINLITYIAKS